MKGRRKVKTAKWALIKGFKEEARQLASCPSDNQGRFMKAAITRGRELEPAGKLAR